MATRRTAKKAVMQAQARWDAGGAGRRIAKWNPPASGPRKVMDGTERLLRRVRDAVRNDWPASAGVDKWVTNLIGVGIQPRWPNGGTTYKAIWDEFVPQADADGVLDAYGLQALITRAWREAGECFVRERPRDLNSPLALPVQVQVLESEMCPVHLTVDVWPGLPAGHKIEQGIERNRFGRRTAFWFYREHPGDDAQPAAADKYVRVPASQVRHVFAPLRPGQLRGVSPLATVLARLRAIGDFDDAVLDRQKLANLFVMLITRPLPQNAADLEFDPLTGLPKFYGNDGTPMVALEPGASAELRPGEDVKFANPPEAGTTYSDYMRTSQLGTAAGQNLPYELMSGDIRDVSDRTLRIVINEFRRLCQQYQWHVIIPQACQGMLDWCVNAAVLAGRLPVSQAGAAKRATWNPHGWEYIHPVQDAEGKAKLVELGVLSKTQVILERGDDPAVVFQQRADDKRLEESLGLDEQPEAAEGFTESEVVSARLSVIEAALNRPPEAPRPTGVEALAPLLDAFTASLAAQREQADRMFAALHDLSVRLADRPLNLTAQLPAQQAPTVNVEGATVIVPPQPAPVVNVAVPETTVNVAAPVVNVDVPAPEVTVNLPERQTTSVIERDPRTGDIVNVTQTERTIN